MENREAALKLAQLPDGVRGYGHVKEAAMDAMDAQWAALMAAYRHPPARIIPIKRQA